MVAPTSLAIFVLFGHTLAIKQKGKLEYILEKYKMKWTHLKKK